MTISSLFIRRPRLAFVVSTVITIAGLLAITALPVAQFPDIVPPQVRVTATYPGASAAGGRGERGPGDRGPGQRRRAHDLHEVDLGRRRQLCADRELRGRLQPRPQHRQRHQPRQPGAGPAAARGAAAGRHHQEAVLGAAAGRGGLFAQGQPRRAVPVQLRDHHPARHAAPRAGRRRCRAVRPARLLDAHLAQPRPHVEPRHHGRRRGQGRAGAERAGRGRPGRRRAADRRGRLPAQHHHPGPPGHDR